MKTCDFGVAVLELCETSIHAYSSLWSMMNEWWMHCLGSIHWWSGKRFNSAALVCWWVCFPQWSSLTVVLVFASSNSWNFSSFAKFTGFFFCSCLTSLLCAYLNQSEIKTTLLCTSGQNTQFQRAYFSSLWGPCWLKVSLFYWPDYFFSCLLWRSHYFRIIELPSSVRDVLFEALPAEYRCLLTTNIHIIQMLKHLLKLCLCGSFFPPVLWIFSDVQWLYDEPPDRGETFDLLLILCETDLNLKTVWYRWSVLFTGETKHCGQVKVIAVLGSLGTVYARKELVCTMCCPTVSENKIVLTCS